jgi:hypothetical protein
VVYPKKLSKGRRPPDGLGGGIDLDGVFDGMGVFLHNYPQQFGSGNSTKEPKIL